MRFHSAHLTAIIGLLACSCLAQKLPQPIRVWSVGPLTKSDPVMGITFGQGGPTITGSHIESQTRSTFSATRSIAFAGDRVILVSRIGMRQIQGTQAPISAFEVLSLDVKTGKLKEKREVTTFGSLPLFGANDDHVIVAGRSLMRMTSDLKDAGEFDYHANGHKFGNVENSSPDGSTLGNATSPGYELVDSQSLQATLLTKVSLADTSVSNKGVVTDNVHWIGQYPKDTAFVTYYDASGDHLLYHGDCGGLTGEPLLTMKVSSPFSYAGVSQNGERFALQLGDPSHERFVIYSVKTGEPITEVKADQKSDEQSWTAFSSDGTMFVVGSPLKLTLYKLP